MSEDAVARSTNRCPPALDAAMRLIVVTAADVNKPGALLTTWERATPAAAWTPVGALREAVVGLNGLAWGVAFRHLAKPGEPLKQEGDKRSPIGIYPLGASFGFDASARPGHVALEKDRHICVEDVRSPHYGRVVERSAIADGIKFDQMRAEPLYRSGLFVDYPPDAALKGGSCIFVHVWRKPGQGTAGCVALDEKDVTGLQDWASAAPTAIAIVTKQVASRFAGCLPP